MAVQGWVANQMTGLGFDDGYRNGRIDALLGLCLIVAMASPHLEYRAGYRTAQAEAEHRGHLMAFRRKRGEG